MRPLDPELCPACHGDSKVVDSRRDLFRHARRRRRECLSCEYRWNTWEVAADPRPKVSDKSAYPNI